MKRYFVLFALVAMPLQAMAASNDCIVVSGTPTLQAGTSAPCQLNTSGQMLSTATGSTASTAILSGQVAVTATAQALPSNTTQSVCVKALEANSIKVYVGPSGVTTSNGMELSAGDGWCTSVSNSNAIYVIASTTGASIAWAGRN